MRLFPRRPIGDINYGLREFRKNAIGALPYFDCYAHFVGAIWKDWTNTNAFYPLLLDS
jgi:hypothetical protein